MYEITIFVDIIFMYIQYVLYIYILSYILNTNVSVRSFMGMRTGNHTSRSLRGWPVLFSRWGSPLEREATASISRANFGTFWNVVHLYTFIYIYDSFMPAILSFWTVWALEVPQLVSIWNLTFFSHYAKGETDFVAKFLTLECPSTFAFHSADSSTCQWLYFFRSDRLTVHTASFRQDFYR